MGAINSARDTVHAAYVHRYRAEPRFTPSLSINLGDRAVGLVAGNLNFYRESNHRAVTSVAVGLVTLSRQAGVKIFARKDSNNFGG